jgi:hypothetical protein
VRNALRDRVGDPSGRQNRLIPRIVTTAVSFS